MQYGKHALDMIATSRDSLRLGWLERLFSSGVRKDELRGRADDAEPVVPLPAAIALIQSVNPAVSACRAEHRFHEALRVRGRTGETPGVPTPVKESRWKGGKGSKKPAGQQVAKQEFIEVFHDLCTRPEIYFLLVQFASNKEFLDTKDLMRFLEAEQGMVDVGSAITHTHRSNVLHMNDAF